MIVSMKNKMNITSLVWGLPYLALLALGVWYRCQGTSVPILDGDSGNYLIPPFLKQLVGEWHKGERPLPYLFFIYYTMQENFDLGKVIIAQKVVSMVGALFLALTWMVLSQRLINSRLLGHLAGYCLVFLYVSNPGLMYYEQFIGPEALSMALMCVLLFCIVLLFVYLDNAKLVTLLVLFTFFLNLYLAVILTKWIFATFFLELILLYLLFFKLPLRLATKLFVLVVSHGLYFLIGVLPERIHTIDHPSQDRVLISLQQMAFTHFDLLAKDKSNFSLSPALQDSMLVAFEEAKLVEPNFLIGFSSDYLMWGKTAQQIVTYFEDDYSRVKQFYVELNWTLFLKYPLELAGSIAKQVWHFFVPNDIVQKRLFVFYDLPISYSGTLEIMQRFDKDIFNSHENWLHTTDPNAPLTKLNFSNQFPTTFEMSGIARFEQLPLVPFQNSFYHWFDTIFFLMLCVVVTYILVFRPKSKLMWLWLLMLSLLFVYVLTVGIVHSFDITRFSFMALPFLFFLLFLSGGLVADGVWSVVKIKLR